MATTRTRKTVNQKIVSETLAALQKALAKRRKDELVETMVKFATNDQTILRDLLVRFEVPLPTRNLVAETQQAIADATDFDERQINRNFDYDYAAYKTIQKNLKRLVDEKQFDDAMPLTLELMRRGSYQVEMSDEGMMTDDIEDCVKIVIAALKRSDVPPTQIAEWSRAMQSKDRVGFICDEELKSLLAQFTK